jgi:thioredoxin reductase
VYDTVIGGGGPAGLIAALVLGRCRRAVLLCDTGTPRNARARALHGFSQTQRTQSDLPRRLSCHLTRHGLVKTDHLGRTGVPELYVAGDASRDVQFAVFAAAEGAKAGVAINQALQEQL